MKHLTRQNQLNCQDKLYPNSSILAMAIIRCPIGRPHHLTGRRRPARGTGTGHQSYGIPTLELEHDFLGVKVKKTQVWVMQLRFGLLGLSRYTLLLTR